VADAEVQRLETLTRQRRQWETETALSTVMSNPEVQRLKEEIEELEASLALVFSAMLLLERAPRSKEGRLSTQRCCGERTRPWRS
jgi:sirohydrochlorin ferrochelatase